MGSKRKQFIIVISTLAILLVLVFIQVRWIIQAAEMQEALFSQCVKLSLARTAERLSQDKRVCQRMETCKMRNQGFCCPRDMGQSELSIVDSILKKDLAFYDINIPYRFEITEENRPCAINCQDKACYNQSLEQLFSQKGVNLKVHFPNKQQFIAAQIGGLFITSIILILLTGASFIFMLFSYRREKRLAQTTKDFINNMTHEFKTPLSTISLASNMIRNEKEPPISEKTLRHADMIFQENRKLKNQVDKLLQVAAMEGADFKAGRKETDVHEIIAELARSFEIQLQSRNGKLNIITEASCYIIQGDRMHLMNAISNLLDNALKYSLENPEISISTRNEDEQLVISVKDNGIGIDRDDQKQIFNKFYRVSTGDIHNVKGFGIGLAYVKMVVQAHRGTITVHSTPGEGSCFEIFLPLV